MNKAKDEMRTEYRREDLGKGVRGKYFARVRVETGPSLRHASTSTNGAGLAPREATRSGTSRF